MASKGLFFQDYHAISQLIVLESNLTYGFLYSVRGQQYHRISCTDDAIILLNFIFTGLHGYQITHW